MYEKESVTMPLSVAGKFKLGDKLQLTANEKTFEFKIIGLMVQDADTVKVFISPLLPSEK